MNGVAAIDFCSAFVAGLISVLAVSSRARTGPVKWVFAAGFFVLAANSVFRGLAANSSVPVQIVFWERWRMVSLSFVPGIWILFSLIYARGNYREFIIRWRPAIAIAFVLPILLALGFSHNLVSSIGNAESTDHWVIKLGPSGSLLNVCVLIFSVIVIMNLERTYRAAIGTMRWRIKFLILGLAVIFAVQAYTASEALLYHAMDLTVQTADSGAILIGCLLTVRSLFREGHFDVDVYPSQSMLQNSVTILFAGAYLLIVGVCAKVVAFFGGDFSFTFKVFVVLLGLVALALVLLSDRVRLGTRRFVSRNFQRPFYDYRMVWKKFTQSTALRVEQADLCTEVVKLVADIFQALSVTIWLFNESQDSFSLGASTALSNTRADELRSQSDAAIFQKAVERLRSDNNPVDLDSVEEKWADELKRLQPDEFHKGGNRVCVRLFAGGELLGVMTLGDRVSGIPFSVQDFDLLKSIADQIASNLLNIKLSQRLSQAKQLEAFQAMSAFFVHDLKNTASTLSLMLQNLPTHFNDPRFREDALRGISKTVKHINDLIRRLSLLREELTIQKIEGDLNASVLEALKCMEPISTVEVVKELSFLPRIRLDPAQMQNVVTNLLLNACDALGSSGRIRVETHRQNGWVVLVVEDSGCGMSSEFVQKSLFRPFQTTKKQGIGIGMFQCKMIIEAHRGKIEVRSELDKGTTFRIFLPVEP